MQRDIAVYSADGELLHWIDEKRLRRLAECGRIARVVKTGRDGSSTRQCTRCPARRGHRSCPTTRARSYCFRQHLEDNHRCHRLRSLGDNRNDDEHYLSPEEVRPIFLRVVLDCLAPRSESCAPSVEATTSRSSTTTTACVARRGITMPASTSSAATAVRRATSARSRALAMRTGQQLSFHRYYQASAGGALPETQDNLVPG